MAETTRLKIGLIGYGPFGEHLARIALNSTKADISMVWTRSKGTADRIRGDGFRATNDVDELINSPEVEAVIVASPNSLHLEHCLKVCDAKKPLWAEKPLVLNLKDYDTIVDAVEKAGIKTHCNFGMRYGGTGRKMIELMDAGKFGDPMHLITRNCRGTGLFSIGSPHKAVSQPELSGGWLMHHMCLQVDFAIRLTKQRIVSVYGRTVKSAPDCPSEESIASICNTEKGAIVEIADGVAPQEDHFLTFIGTRASAHVQGKSLNFRGFDEENKSYGDDSMRGFISHVTGCDPGANYPVPVVPIQEGRHALEVLLAIKESAETGKVVEL